MVHYCKNDSCCKLEGPWPVLSIHGHRLGGPWPLWPSLFLRPCCYSEPKKTDNIKYNTRAANIDLMKQILSDIDRVSILDPLNTNDIWLQFKSIFQDTFDKCVPTYKQKEKKNLYCNSEVFCLKGKRNQLWKKYLPTLNQLTTNLET